MTGTQTQVSIQTQADDAQRPPPSDQYLAALWAEIIGLDSVAPSDNFLDVGGNSLTLNVVINRICIERGVTMNPQRFFEPDTSLLDLARDLDALLATGSSMACSERQEVQTADA